jgi:hypothetical protein
MNDRNEYKELIQEALDILSQEVNVYPMGRADWAFANAGVISDGYSNKDKAIAAARKQIISCTILHLEEL